VQLSLVQTDLAAHITPALALLLPEGARELTGFAAQADKAAGSVVSALLKQGDFRGKPGEVHVLYAPEASFERVIVSALGKPAKLTLEHVRDAAGKAATFARDLGLPSLTVALPDFPADAGELARAVGEGILLSQFQFNDYRTKDLDEVKALKAAQVLAPAGADVANGLKTAQVLAEVINTARRWILHPGQELPPSKLAEVARKEAEAVGLKVTVLDKAQLQAQGFNTLLAVGQGSVNDPCLIRIDYRGGGDEAPVAVVGKGITFDTGGLQIKPGPGMEKMKYDMAGGAAAIAIVLACAKLGLKRNVTTIVPAAENMPSGSAVKPSDVVTSYAGLTIEINDTDAEGRLVLADALAYAAQEVKPAWIVDMATLTGSVGVALGKKTFGVMGTDQALVDQFRAIAEHAGERCWQLPLLEEYEENIQSDIADLKNYGGRWGDTVNAATFLKHFVGDVPYLHLDIAGAGWSDVDRGYRPKGPTGTPVRAVVDLIASGR
jgi:leucyl aminopeptidase